jgi:hypothetical protein
MSAASQVAPIQAREAAPEGVDLTFVPTRVQAVVSSPEGLTFQAFGTRDGGQRVCLSAMSRLEGISDDDHLVSINGADVSHATMFEVLQRMQEVQAGPSAWPVVLEFERVGGSPQAQVAQAVDDTELVQDLARVSAPGEPTLNPRLMAPILAHQAPVSAQLTVTPIARSLSYSILLPFLIVGGCGYVSFRGLLLRSFDTSQALDTDIATFTMAGRFFSASPSQLSTGWWSTYR